MFSGQEGEFIVVPHAIWLELAFFVSAVFGTGMAIWGLTTATKDSKVKMAEQQRRHERRVPSPLLIATLNRLYQISFRLAIHAVMLVVASLAILFPPPPPDYSIMPQVTVSIVGWVIASVLLSLKEIADRRERITLERLYEDMQTYPVTHGHGRSDRMDAVNE